MNQGERGFIKFIKLLREAGQVAGQPTLTAALGTLVGESYASSFSFLVQNADELEAVYEAGLTGAGEAARQAQIRMTGSSGAWESFKAQLDTVKNTLGEDGIDGALESIFRRLADGMKWFTEPDAELRKLVVGALLAGPALLGMGVALRAMSWMLGGLVPLMNPIVLAIALVAAAGFALWYYWNDIIPAWQRGIDSLRDKWLSLIHISEPTRPY